MRQVSVVGTSGSGKSWLASRLASALGVPWLELDSIRHQRDWEPLPDGEFIERASSFVRRDGWVVDGNYLTLVTEPLIWPAADTVVWIDLSKTTVMCQVLSRTLKRGLSRQELWNGNRERLRDVLHRDPDRSIIRWAWTSHGANREHYQAAMSDPRWNHLTFVRLRTQAEMRRFLAALPCRSA